ncbi:MAG: hypothetical protein ACW98Y_19985 [Candidatus Thorarchaeota archaeon]
MSKKSSKPALDLTKFEMKKLREMRSISYSLDSPDLGTMYTAAGKLMAYPAAKSLLPKAMSLLSTTDATLRRLVYRMAGRNIYGDYVPELFNSMRSINPAEREQVLQGIEELFLTTGSPKTASEQKRWITALSQVGHEHQATTFGIMASLGAAGLKWVKNKIKNNIETISIGTIPKLRSFDDKDRTELVKLLTTASSKKKRELLPYICEVVEPATVKYLRAFLGEGKWQDRVYIAKAVGGAGVTSATGLVMDIIADPDWRVKQELLENVNIPESKFSSLTRVLSYMIGDSHSRVRGQADRLILELGVTECTGSNLESQRKKLEKQFRVQLLRGASSNKDIDSKWLGVEVEDHPIPIILEEGEAEGVSLADLQPVPEEKEEPASPQIDLMAALLKARGDAAPQDPIAAAAVEPEQDLDVESSLPNTEKFMLLLKKLSKGTKRGVNLKRIKSEASSLEMSDEEVDEALEQLERDGLVYRSKGGTIKRVDIEL